MKPRRKKKYSPIISVVGKLANLMLGMFFNPKYSNLGSPNVCVYINIVLIWNTLIDLGVAINVMKKDTMLKINLRELLIHTTIDSHVYTYQLLVLKEFWKMS
jgi:hypothetical protein